MSAIKMKVMIQNDTHWNLYFKDRSLDHGEWNPGWVVPQIISPSSQEGFAAESEVFVAPTTGTEGRIRYQVGEDPGAVLYIHFDSPLVESQYGNTFHVLAPPGYEASWTGGQGHEAVLEVRLRETARRGAPGFDPATHGLLFANDWDGSLPAMTVGYLWNRLRKELPKAFADLLEIVPVDDGWLPLTQADAGLCGGMVYTVMDFWNAFGSGPTRTDVPTTPTDPWFAYIRDRLLDSFDITGHGHRFLAYSSPVYPNGDEGFVQNVLGLWYGRSWVTYRQEWPRIRAELDAGRLCPLGLIQTDSLDIGANHQTLAYAYLQSGQAVTLFTYDPNVPGQEVRLEFDIADTTGEVHVRRFVGVGSQVEASSRRIFAIMKLDGYHAHTPPFDAPTDDVGGAIGVKWRQFGGAGGSLGSAMSPDEEHGLDSGQLRRFAKGIVTCHPQFGPHAFTSEIAGAFDAAGGVAAGHYATSDGVLAPDTRGHVAHFRTVTKNESFSIWWTPQTDAHVIFGDIERHWIRCSGERGPLGYPTGTEVPGPDGSVSVTFESGIVTWHPSVGAHGLWWDVYLRYAAMGGANAAVATTDSEPTPDSRGFYADFLALPARSPFSIYWSRETGAQLVYGDIRSHWLSLGGTSSALGFPTTEEVDAPGGGRDQSFEHGRIHWDPTHGAKAV